LLIASLAVSFCATTTLHNQHHHNPISGYIIAESDGGLSNRLRTIMSHIFIAKVMHDNANVVFVWNVNDACPGHFLEIFRPLNRVAFASNETRQIFAQHALKVPSNHDHF
jgi:hypothetical protein